jgi:5-methyltetrahydrofolate--homocysteine methyltransferase
MQYVAAEMHKDDYFRIKKIPLLIGGATCSRVHTAVKIAPHYEGPVVYVPDASRSVGVAQNLLGDNAASFVQEVQADYDKVRSQHANKKQVPLWPLDKARANRTAIDWAAYQPTVPRLIGRRVFRTSTWPNSCLHRLGPVLPDLGPGGPYPAILQDEVVGEQARRCSPTARPCSRRSSRAAGCRPAA